MESCAVPSSVDMDEVITKSYITKMLSDNYTLLIVFVILICILIFVLIYFVNQGYISYKLYKNSSTDDPPSPEDEVYDDENEPTVDPNKFKEANEQKFYKNIEATYKNYNKEKTNYIKSTYNDENDDIIDEKIIYSKYDNYSKNMPQLSQ